RATARRPRDGPRADLMAFSSLLDTCIAGPARRARPRFRIPIFVRMCARTLRSLRTVSAPDLTFRAHLTAVLACSGTTRRLHSSEPTKGAPVPELDRDRLVWMFTQMLRIREFEERVKRTFEDHPGVIRGHTHLADGAEASIVGSLATMQPGDQLMATYRCHGYPIALGTETKSIMAEIYGRKSGLCGGYGGSMHLVDPSRGFMGTSGIVGQGIPQATGLAFAAQISKRNQVVLCFFGDG